jgi:DNA anti-recombination protein RmuC
LVKSKCGCEIHDDGEYIPNTYKACYYIKEGKKVKRVEIPEFEIDLSKLFYLTREEYDAGLGEYVRAMEDLLRQKFGKYWDDEGFALDEVLDNIVAEIQADFQVKAEEILAEVNRKAEETLNSVNERVDQVETELNAAFETLSKDLNEEFDSMQSDFDAFKTQTNESITSIDARVTEMGEKMQSDFEELSKGVDDKFEVLQGDVQTRIDTISDHLALHIIDADETYLAKTDTISITDFEELK